jgi:hypothetical protein
MHSNDPASKEDHPNETATPLLANPVSEFKHFKPKRPALSAQIAPSHSINTANIIEPAEFGPTHRTESCALF